MSHESELHKQVSVIFSYINITFCVTGFLDCIHIPYSKIRHTAFQDLNLFPKYQVNEFVTSDYKDSQENF